MGSGRSGRGCATELGAEEPAAPDLWQSSGPQTGAHGRRQGAQSVRDVEVCLMRSTSSSCRRPKSALGRDALRFAGQHVSRMSSSGFCSCSWLVCASGA